MEIQFSNISISSLRTSSKLTNRSTKVPNEVRERTRTLRAQINTSKRSVRVREESKSLQKDPKKKLSQILRTESAIRNIERKANSSKDNNLWPKALLEALDQAIHNNFYETALKIFQLLRIQQWYIPRHQTYTKLLMMLGKCNKPNQAKKLFNLMSSDGLKPTLATYTALINAYAQTGLFDEAFSTLNFMKSIPDCFPDVYTYSILLNCSAKHRRFDLVERVLDDMSFFEIECSNVTYNTLIHAYGKAGMFEEMESLTNEMIESETCDPDLYTLNSLVGAYGYSGRIEKMEEWFDAFRVMGISPDANTFNVMIRSYGKARMFDKMRNVISFMEERFSGPNVVTFNTIIDVFGSVGDVPSMEKYFKTMKHRGLKPNSITFCSLVSAFSRAGLVGKVDSIVRQVENSDVLVDTALMNCVMSAYGKFGDLKKMSQVFLAMKQRKCCPDDITFAIMVRAFGANGMSEVAHDLERVMSQTKDYSEILKFLPG